MCPLKQVLESGICVRSFCMKISSRRATIVRVKSAHSMMFWVLKETIYRIHIVQEQAKMRRLGCVNLPRSQREQGRRYHAAYSPTSARTEFWQEIVYEARRPIFSSNSPLNERSPKPTTASKCNESIYDKLYSHPAAAAGSGAAAGQNIIGELVHVQDHVHVQDRALEGTL